MPCLCDDIRDQLILKHANPVFQCQFLPLQPRNLQLIRHWIGLERSNRIVKIAVFDLKQFNLLTDTLVVHGAPVHNNL